MKIKHYIILLFFTVLICIFSCNNDKSSLDINLNKQSIKKHLNNRNYKIFNNTSVKFNENEHILNYGKIFFCNKNIKSAKRKSEFFNYGFEENFFLKPEQGKAQFYRIKLPSNIKIDYNLFLSYTSLKDDIISQDNFALKLHYLFSNNSSNYYGFFIPFNLYSNIIKYEITLKIAIDDIYNLEIRQIKFLAPKEWKKQSVIFNYKKTSEILKFDRLKYELERKERMKILNENNSAVYFHSGFIYPLDFTEYITSEFGLIREWKNQDGILFSKDTHTGLDFANNINSSVYAAADGIVRYSKLSELTGNNVIIEHGLSLYTNYNHLNEIFVKPGDKVIKNQIIGTVGTTGASTGYHLHWETKIYNKYVDPRSFFNIYEVFKP